MKRRVVLALLLGLTVVGTIEAQPPARPRQAGFDPVFGLPGVELTEAQQAQVEKLREKYAPQLVELQKKQFGLLTDQQRTAQREAFRAAREGGKEGRAFREAIDAAVQLSDEQKEVMAKIQAERTELLAKIHGDLRKLLTAEQQAKFRPRRRPTGPAMPPTHADVKYGPFRRNVMDVWLAESEQPTPVLVSIHGGGFRNGNKSVSGELLRECLKSGISVVAITYRLSDEAIAPAQFLDSARAIQFIRHNARQWNLDPTRMAATGGSAGAGLSLWLGFHDDLADPDNEDPVLRESSRLSCMAVFNGQTSYDPRFIRKLFPEYDVYKESALAQLYDIDPEKLDELPAEKYRLFEEVSAMPHLTRDDPPALLIYVSKMDAPITSPGVGIHHPRFGKVLKEKMDALGIECQVHAGIDRGSPQRDGQIMNFVKKHLKVKERTKGDRDN